MLFLCKKINCFEIVNVNFTSKNDYFEIKSINFVNKN